MSVKRALVTSGGGAKGAFSVGALLTLEKYGLADFDIISGTSTGSLIAALAAANQYNTLKREYTIGTNRDFLKHSNIIRNLSENKAFIYDTLPLENKIDTIITEQIYEDIKHKTICFSSVSLQTGRRSVFTTQLYENPNPDQYDLFEITDYEMFKKAILGSTNQAAFLPPISIYVKELDDTQQFVDGGNRDVLPTQPAIDLNPDEIYVLSNNPKALSIVRSDYTSVFDVLFRAISIFIQDIRENDYAVLKEFSGKVYEIEPKMELDRNNPTGLNFNRKDMARWMTLGEMTARKILISNHVESGSIVASLDN